MYDERLRRTIRKLLFVSPALSRAFLSGGFRSVFKGRGIEFDSVREYAPEDDARAIDWNATVRFGRPYVKTWCEDRSLSIHFIYDESDSMDYGVEGSCSESAAVACSLLAYAASLSSIPVGAIFFSGEINDIVPPSVGQRRALALAQRFSLMARQDAAASHKKPGSALAQALDTARRRIKRRSLIFIVSDFKAAAEGNSGYARPLALLARAHDVVALRISEKNGLLTGNFKATLKLQDAESGRRVRIAFGSKATSEDFMRVESAARLEWLRSVASARASRLELNVGEDPAKALVRFFARRVR